MFLGIDVGEGSEISTRIWRFVRSKEDWAKTYLLDSAFANFVNRNRNMLPDWFVQAMRPISFDSLRAHL